MRAEATRAPSLSAGARLSGALRSGRLPALLVVLACALLLYGFLNSGAFAVSRVEVRGVSLGDAGAVAAEARALNESVFRVDSDAIADRVAQQPTVDSAAVHAELPDRVVIEVVERTPALAWQAGGETLLVDARGHVLATGAPGALPTIATAGPAPALGATLPVARVTAALAIAAALQGQAQQLRWSDADGFVATLSGNRTLQLGDETDVPRKLAAAQAVLAASGNWTLLDVSEPDRPYTR